MSWKETLKKQKQRTTLMVDPAQQEEMDKALVGGQKELDRDKDGDIDAKDFKQIREEKK